MTHSDFRPCHSLFTSFWLLHSAVTPAALRIESLDMARPIIQKSPTIEEYAKKRHVRLSFDFRRRKTRNMALTWYALEMMAWVVVSGCL